MSEYINNTSDRIQRLYEFSHRLIDGENGKMLIETYKNVIDNVSAAEAMQIFDMLLQKGYSNEIVKSNVGKIINVFFKSLNSLQWSAENKFLQHLILENREAEKIMYRIRQITKSLFNDNNAKDTELFDQLKKELNQLNAYELHYIKKENILFPYIEKVFPQYRCLQLMWSFHDDYRKSQKRLEFLLDAAIPDKAQINTELGKLFFVILPIIFREEKIVFPVAQRAIPEKDWLEMLQQSVETGWAYGVEPEMNSTQTDAGLNYIKGQINLGTGFLTTEQLILLLNNLPVDITYVDDNDEVRYFSGAKHRIFPRSNAIIGRKVQNCHPPESVHVVNEIVNAFRSGAKNHADFRIQMKGRFIHIRYFALRDEEGKYKGTIEVSQDVTEIRDLEGEQRLLDWNKIS